MFRLVAMAIVTVLLVFGNGRSEEDMAAKSPQTSLWCVSDCGTCPIVCSPPSPPPKASINLVPSVRPPAKKAPSPPPPPPPLPPSTPSWSFSSSPYSSSSSPSGGQERGGFSYPYYYFYSSDALRAHGLLHVSLRLVPLLWVLFSIV
ncbi:hypothetical protein M5K25_023373 [Dendrobium thyrsiflorum]|uniref:Uncharacterized protein n=1 Tax=Dendrobium thyrsiflorum TaxID=117978 RepID=A0ABD0UEX9_DENTH